ncbi:FAD-dependent thymidylate synthase, partial [Candidatus Sumerlaeota bacterium]|nr:FAD-dependent thymidylate synthase [Candidatus Sumerlaeota bacterium]
VPPRIAEKQELQKKFKQIMEQLFHWYNEFTEAGIPPEDARFILPAGVCTNLVVTMNARELLHFFSLRCCRRAQWEIRSVAWRMLKCVKTVAPILFENAGPNCMTPKGCQEGNNSCGSPYTPQEVTTLLASLP